MIFIAVFSQEQQLILWISRHSRSLPVVRSFVHSFFAGRYSAYSGPQCWDLLSSGLPT